MLAAAIAVPALAGEDYLVAGLIGSVLILGVLGFLYGDRFWYWLLAKLKWFV